MPSPYPLRAEGWREIDAKSARRACKMVQETDQRLNEHIDMMANQLLQIYQRAQTTSNDPAAISRLGGGALNTAAAPVSRARPVSPEGSTRRLPPVQKKKPWPNATMVPDTGADQLGGESGVGNSGDARKQRRPSTRFFA